MFDEKIFTVSRLNHEVRVLLELSFQTIWIEGEISNFVVPSSGHWYFSLKDANAQVRCAMFKPKNTHLGFTPKNGMHVKCKAKISLYEDRGDFQLIMENMEETGEGKLRLAFEQLKKKLLTLGWFDNAQKKQLPALPKSIGIITSATGAAVRDILNVLKRRFPLANIIIYPCLVQGYESIQSISRAIDEADSRKECDVLILARGGGSLEDFQAFNSEEVAKAIYSCSLPIITGIGHEIDFTIADFVADQRAPTPSAAAELVAPSLITLSNQLNAAKQKLIKCMTHQIANHAAHLTNQKHKLQRFHPQNQLQSKTQQLDYQLLHLQQLISNRLMQYKITIQKNNHQLTVCSPSITIQNYKQMVASNLKRLNHCIGTHLCNYQLRFAQLVEQLDLLSPLATLKRGYCIASNQSNIITQSRQLQRGDHLKLTFNQGFSECKVLYVSHEENVTNNQNEEVLCP